MSYQFLRGEWTLADRPLLEFTQGRSRPFYLYDLDDVEARARHFLTSGASVHYAMKANSHARLLRLILAQGLGVDVVSGGEMQRALSVGFSPKQIIFSGVGKDEEELGAALDHQILQINVESFEELKALAELARARRRSADVALRLNIHLEAPTHKNIQTATLESKFGIDLDRLPEILRWLKSTPELRLKGLAVHIGSQILEVDVFRRMSQQMGQLYRDVQAQGFALERLDLGGGLGIDYRSSGDDDFARFDQYKLAIAAHGTNARIHLEPGRFLTARMGALLTKVVYVKRGTQRSFLILGAGMNALMRPALYQAYHRIEPLRPRVDAKRETFCVVGPVCESTDVFADARELPTPHAGDWMAIFDAGAYGAAMANTYNETPVPDQLSLHQGRLEIT